MIWLRQIIRGDKQLVKAKAWIPCTFRFNYRECSKEDCIMFGLNADDAVQSYLPNHDDW